MRVKGPAHFEDGDVILGAEPLDHGPILPLKLPVGVRGMGELDLYNDRDVIRKEKEPIRTTGTKAGAVPILDPWLDQERGKAASDLEQNG